MTSHSIHRRRFLSLASAGAAFAMLTQELCAATNVRLVLVHGRAQQGKDPALLKSQWIDALRKGAQAIEKPFPQGLDVAFPYYGDLLDKFAREFDLPLSADVLTKGARADGEFLSFEIAVADELRASSGLTDADIDAEYGMVPKPKGLENLSWVQAILRALDKRAGWLSEATVETFIRDVFLYTRRAGVRAEVDQIVAQTITLEPTVVIGHSLGSVVAYHVLRNDPRKLRIPLFLTLGSPLAIHAIRDQFRPLRFPVTVQKWYNAFDARDVVALNALDGVNFPVAPEIENYSRVNNHTDNRHGIVGYLDDPEVARRLLNALG